MSKLEQAIKELQELGRSTALNVVYVTEPSHRKTGNPFYHSSTKSWGIEKVGTFNALVGVSYQNVINNQRKREDLEADFESKPIWNGSGEHFGKYLIRHTKTHKLYLALLPTSGTAKVQYVFKEDKRPLNESELTILEAFTSERVVSASQGTEKPVFWNIIALENLRQLTFNHQTYVLGE